MHPSLHISRVAVDAELAAFGTSVGVLGQSGECNPFRLAVRSVLRAESDWDCCALGRGITRKSASLDLVYVSPERVETLEWLG